MLYIKALHIIFIVTWFAGLFYIVRLFIYNTEAAAKAEPERSVLMAQFSIMISRLWKGIAWPSAILTAIFGPWVMLQFGWERSLNQPSGQWLLVKLFFVAGLYVYHFALHSIYKQQKAGVFKYTSNQLRIWNEVATLFLVAITMLATVKQAISWVWGISGLLALMILLLLAIRIYKNYRRS
ncbi:MAG: CopD family protein [Flavisolibacter sp.]|jgi:putative membrane protein|nr:CopD family protein [Flavisolibacter sp.]